MPWLLWFRGQLISLGVLGSPGRLRCLVRALLCHHPQVTVGQLHPDGRSRVGGGACQRLHQGPVGQAQDGAGGLGRHAYRERITPGMSGDRLGEPAPQVSPLRRISEPATRDRRRVAAHAHGGQRSCPQQPVATQQVIRLRKVRPGGQLASGRGRRTALDELGRRDIEHRRAEDHDGGATRIAEQDAIADVQRQRVLERQPRESGAGGIRRPQGPDPDQGAGGADVQGHFGRRGRSLRRRPR